mmetsp:Transcript_11408/g.34929  ORF Transcript_11408/g.34929 Transcript_11408/m.34929 type:complete len:241 (-) Transcript_11408:1609-2331(-)
MRQTRPATVPYTRRRPPEMHPRSSCWPRPAPSCNIVRAPSARTSFTWRRAAALPSACAWRCVCWAPASRSERRSSTRATLHCAHRCTARSVRTPVLCCSRPAPTPPWWTTTSAACSTARRLSLRATTFACCWRGWIRRVRCWPALPRVASRSTLRQRTATVKPCWRCCAPPTRRRAAHRRFAPSSWPHRTSRNAPRCTLRRRPATCRPHCYWSSPVPIRRYPTSTAAPHCIWRWPTKRRR